MSLTVVGKVRRVTSEAAVWKMAETFNLGLSLSKGEHMAKEPVKHKKPWTPREIRELQKLVGENTPTRLIVYKLSRTESSVRAKASYEGISLKPTNQSPYTRRRR